MLSPRGRSPITTASGKSVGIGIEPPCLTWKVSASAGNASDASGFQSGSAVGSINPQYSLRMEFFLPWGRHNWEIRSNYTRNWRINSGAKNIIRSVRHAGSDHAFRIVPLPRRARGHSGLPRRSEEIRGWGEKYPRDQEMSRARQCKSRPTNRYDPTTALGAPFGVSLGKIGGKTQVFPPIEH